MPLRAEAPIGAPCWVDIMTSDPAKTQAFYTELFGWTVDDPGPDYGGYINFHRDGVPVAGCMGHSGEGPANIWSIYLATDDAEKTCEAAAAHGGMVMFPPMDVMALGKMSMVLDPGGAAIGVWQPGEFNGFGVLAEPNAPAWFELHTREYAKAVQFYRDVFKWDTHVTGDSDEFRYTTLGEGESQAAGIMDASIFPADAPVGLVGVLRSRRHRRRAREGRQARRCDGDPGRGHAVRSTRGRDRRDRLAVQVRLGHELLSARRARLDRRDAPAVPRCASVERLHEGPEAAFAVAGAVLAIAVRLVHRLVDDLRAVRLRVTEVRVDVVDHHRHRRGRRTQRAR